MTSTSGTSAMQRGHAKIDPRMTLSVRAPARD